LIGKFSLIRAVSERSGRSTARARGFVIVNIFRFIKCLPTRPGNAARPAICSTAAMILAVLAPLCVLPPTSVAALAAAEAITLTLKEHLFVPSEVSVPAGERFRIEIENQDPTPAEFESADLRVEKIVVPGGKIAVMAGPLKPGIYKFFDDYHPDTAKGTVTAVAKVRD
jgi:cupredoxin-like protein